MSGYPTVAQIVTNGILGAYRMSDGTVRAETDEECSRRTGLPLIDGLMIIRDKRPNRVKPVCIECEEIDGIFTPT